MARRSRPSPKQDIAAENLGKGLDLVAAHPLFAPLRFRAAVRYLPSDTVCPPDGWAVVTSNGFIYAHPTRRADPAEWQYVLCHCLLHLALGHIRPMEHQLEWNTACDVVVARFLHDLRIGKPPAGWPLGRSLPTTDEQRLYEAFVRDGVPPDLWGCGTGAPRGTDMVCEPLSWRGQHIDWTAAFAQGLSDAVASAVEVAAGVQPALGASNSSRTIAQLAHAWFISTYPLLGALAAAFEIIEDPIVCQRLEISVAAVDPEAGELYVNPAAGLDMQEMRFVMAHELLHVGLRHAARRQGRDPFLWNVACDYVINAWLTEMEIGYAPAVGLLIDPALSGLSAEAVYDRIVGDLRLLRRLRTFRGIGKSDILERHPPNWWELGGGVDLDAFYRQCLTQGLIYHTDQGRGLLPAALVEEIRAMDQPAIPWDVELAQWFDDCFAPLEKVRSYARPSRRQSATPDIPRPRWIPAEGATDGRTFGVVLDTSGSMDRHLLAKALGAIASYSISRDVPRARVIFCDAAAYDEGYISPDDIAGRVKVKGRGGTVLQPGIDLLESAEDFPKTGPILIITDGGCEDKLRIRRQHAYLMPEKNSLPFAAHGKIFRIR